jgi:tetratricopeptide (TPR) repeat protein
MRSMVATCGLAAALVVTTASAATRCGELANAVGPYDYRNATQQKRELIERFHFTESVETLRKGQSSVSIGADISYTLRVFPNHPRALNSMAELARMQKTDRPAGSPYTIECWFERAVRFRPEDGNVRLVYGIALLKSGQREEAIDQLKKADELVPHNANVHYNLGLAYFGGHDYEKAREHAKIAYKLGFPLPGLREMLERAKQWQ